MLPVKQLSVFFFLIEAFFVCFCCFTFFVCFCCLQCFPIMLILKLWDRNFAELVTFTSFLFLLITLRLSFCAPFLGVRADSGVLPKREASLRWKSEQRWRVYARCDAKEDPDGSWWFWEHQESQIVHASTVPQGVYVGFFLRSKTTTSVKVIVINDAIEIWRIMWKHS